MEPSDRWGRGTRRMPWPDQLQEMFHHLQERLRSSALRAVEKDGAGAKGAGVIIGRDRTRTRNVSAKFVRRPSVCPPCRRPSPASGAPGLPVSCARDAGIASCCDRALRGHSVCRRSRAGASWRSALVAACCFPRTRRDARNQRRPSSRTRPGILPCRDEGRGEGPTSCPGRLGLAHCCPECRLHAQSLRRSREGR